MDSSVLIAIVTAIASIVVAFIQVTTSLKVTRILLTFGPSDGAIYVAGVVTLINVFAVVIPSLFRGYISLHYSSILALLFVGSAILAAGIAYLKQRNPATL